MSSFAFVIQVTLALVPGLENELRIVDLPIVSVKNSSIRRRHNLVRPASIYREFNLFHRLLGLDQQQVPATIHYGFQNSSKPVR
jgi:hypothetical protein